MATEENPVQKFKRLTTTLLEPEERKLLQSYLSAFIQEKSFENLRTGLATTITTPERKPIAWAIQALIPAKYHADYLALLNSLGLGPDGTPHVYTNWNVPSANPFEVPSTGGITPSSAPYVNVETNPAVTAQQTPTYVNTTPSAATPTPPRVATNMVPPILSPSAGKGGNLPSATPPALSRSMSSRDTPPSAVVNSRSVERSTSARETIPEEGSLSRQVSTRPGSAGVQAMSPPPVMPKLKEIKSETMKNPWTADKYLAGRIARGEAEALLKNAGWSEGLFLVREKGDAFNSLVLSLVHSNQPLHLLLEQRGSDPFTINGEAFGECRSLEEVIDLMRSLGPSFQYRLTMPFLMAKK